MNHRIVLVDKKYRKKVLIIYFISVALGAALIIWGLPWVKGQIEELDNESALNNLIMLVRFMFLSIVPLGFFISFLKSAKLSFVPIPNIMSCSMGITSTAVLNPQSVNRKG